MLWARSAPQPWLRGRWRWLVSGSCCPPVGKDHAHPPFKRMLAQSSRTFAHPNHRIRTLRATLPPSPWPCFLHLVYPLNQLRFLSTPPIPSLVPCPSSRAWRRKQGTSPPYLSSLWNWHIPAVNPAHAPSSALPALSILRPSLPSRHAPSPPFRFTSLHFPSPPAHQHITV